MKIVRSLGQSITQFDAGPTFKRRAHVRRRSDGADRLEDTMPFLAEDPNLLIRQCISAIDKIYSKPKSLGEMSLDWYDAREALGQACWTLLKSRFKSGKTSELAKIWRWKLHPYADHETAEDDRKQLQNNADKTKAAGKKHGGHTKRGNGQDERPGYAGRWHDAFAKSSDGKPNDAETIAKTIERHLFEQEATLRGAARTGQGKQPNGMGLIARRAGSIETSVYAKHDRLDTVFSQPGWTKKDEAIYGRANVAKTILDTAKKLEVRKTRQGKAIPARLTTSDVGKALYAHYEAIGLCDPDLDQQQRNRLHALHDAVKAFYRSRIRNSKRGTRGHHGKKLSSLLPATMDGLFGKLDQKRNNAALNDLIRHGRMLYHSKLNPEVLNDPAKGPNYYWTSDGQADIKRMEAFTRVWRTVKDQAARTVKAWADPEEQLRTAKGDDILNHTNIEDATEDAFDADAYEQKVRLLFGSAARLFLPVAIKERKNLLFAALKITAKIRNEITHFSTRQQFAQTLKMSLSSITEGIAASASQQKVSQQTQAAINRLLEQDHAKERERINAVLEGASLHLFATTPQIMQLVRSVQEATPPDISLPKFNRLLNRLDGTRGHLKPSDLRAHFPHRANRLNLDEPSARCRFVSLKMIYETSFCPWLTGLDTGTLQTFIDQALEEGAKLAKAPNRTAPYQEQIRAKAESVAPSAKGGIARLFDDLAAVVATELRDQNAYEPNPEKAREQSAWIEQFKCDLMGIAFAHFVDEKGFDWLAKITPKDEITARHAQGQFHALAGSQTNSPVDAWQANLYFFLHLVPVDDVSMLAHQLRKTAVLDDKAGSPSSTGSPDLVKALQDIVTLYLTMHDAKFEGTIASMPLDGFAAFFENPDDFHNVYNDEHEQAAPMMSMRRGLREVMRFGHLERLRRLFEGEPVAHQDVETVLGQERAPSDKPSTIAVWQAEREALHRDLTEKKGSDTPDVLARYKKLVGIISTHRLAAADVRLQTHARLHQLMMRVMGRLIDYVGLWERDRLFVFLALLEQQRQRGETGQQTPKPDFPTDRDLTSEHSKPGTWKAWPAFLTRNNRALFDEHFGGKDGRAIRNDFAHHSVLSARHGHVDLTEQMNRIRRLVAHDRKLKNAVAKSIKELLAREGLEATWTMDGHDLKLAGMTARPIVHLGGKKVDGEAISELAHGDRFVRLTKALFSPAPSETASDSGGTGAEPTSEKHAGAA